ncbi:hypothetical protein D3C74_421900 [compost metagenome]
MVNRSRCLVCRRNVYVYILFVMAQYRSFGGRCGCTLVSGGYIPAGGGRFTGCFGSDGIHQTSGSQTPELPGVQGYRDGDRR